MKPKANVILGARINPEFKNEIKLFTIMTGINDMEMVNQIPGMDSSFQVNI